MALLPLGPTHACRAGFEKRIALSEMPYTIPTGLVAQHFHLSNQVSAFKPLTKPRRFDLKDKSAKMTDFSLIGVGTPINPWTYWLTRHLPEWLVAQPKYIPVFAQESSCTESYTTQEAKVDQTVLLVGKTLETTDGETIFAASSYRPLDGLWTNYNGTHLGPT